MRLVYLLLLCSLSSFAQHEGMTFNQGQVILDSDLIVIAKPRSDAGETFKAEILEVIKDERYGLKKGDYLRMKDNVTLSCGFIENVTQEVDTAVFMLRKGENEWEFMVTDYIPQFVNGIAQMYFMGCEYRANSEKYITDIQDFVKEFELDSSGHIDVSKRHDEDITAALSDLVLHYYLVHHIDLTSKVSSPLVCQMIDLEGERTILPPSEDLRVYEVLDHPATSVLGNEALIKKISEEVSAYMISLGIQAEGRSYIELIIEKDGTVSKATTVRGLIQLLDQKAEELLLQSKWNPAKDHFGQPKRFRVVIPVTIRSKQ